MKPTTFRAHSARLAICLSLASTAITSADLTWDPDLGGSPFGGVGIWDTTTANWWNGAANDTWDNTGATAGIIADAGGELLLATGANLVVGDLTLNAGLGTAVVLTAETDNEGLTLVGSPTWAINDNVLAFTNNQVNDTSLAMTPLETLTVTGTGTFNTGENPNGADWAVAGANLVIDGPIFMRGPVNTVGQFSAVSMADGSTFRYQRNTDGFFANAWVLPSGNVTFDRQWNARNAVYNGVVTGSGGITVGVFGSGFTVFNGANTFTGKVNVNGRMAIDADESLGAVPVSPVADQLSFGGGLLRSTGALTIPANRGITLGASGGTLENTSDPIVVDSVITGAGDLTLLGPDTTFLNGVNTYTGRTIVDGGTLNITAESALGTAPGSPVADSMTLRNGGTIFPNNIATFDSNRGITLDNGGGIIASNSPKTYGGTITGTGPFQLGRDDGFANSLTLTADTHDYTGETVIRKGRLALGIDEALPSETVVRIGGTGGAVSHFRLESHAQTIGGLTTAGNNTRQVMNFDSAAAPSLTPGELILDVADGESHIYGSAFGVNDAQERGNFNITKNGLGVQRLNNVRLGGSVQVNAGTLQLGSVALQAGDITVSGGQLDILNQGNSIDIGNVLVDGGLMTLDDTVNADSWTVTSPGILSIGNGAGTEAQIGSDLDITNNGTVLFNRTGTTTYAGVISGSGGLQVNGGGTVTLTGENTLTGPIEVVDGQLFAGNATALPDFSAITVAGGEVFGVPFDGTAFSSSDLANLSTTVTFLDPTAYLGLGLTAGSQTLADNLTGPHSLQMAGTDTDILAIGTAQSYTGDTRIFQGQLDLTANDQLPATAEMQIGGAGIAEFNLNGFNQTVAGLPNTLGSTRRINNRTAIDSTLTLDVAGGESFTYDANIQEDGTGKVNLVKNGAGSQAFEKNGFTSYTGSATVNGGELRFRFPNDIDPAVNAITANPGGTFGIDAGGGVEWMTADIDSLLTNGTFAVGSFLGIRTAGDSYTATNDLSGAFGLIKSGDQNLTLTGNNTYAGPTIITNGILEIDSEERLGTAPGTPASDHLLIDGGSLRALADMTIDDANRGISIGAGGASIGVGVFSVDLATPLSGSGDLTVTSGNILTAGALKLTGTNSFAGKLTVTQGVLEVGNAGNLPATATVEFEGSGILQLAGNIDAGASDFTRPLGTAPGEISWPNGGGFSAVGADRTIDIGGAGADLEWGVGGFMPAALSQNFAFFLGSTSATHTAILENGLILPDGAEQYSIRTIDGPVEVEGEVTGLISGPGGLRVRDDGTIRLSGNNTYAGLTSVEGTTTLLINGDQSSASGPTVVATGATLGGAGTVGGFVTIQGGGTLAPGASVGTLTTVDAFFGDNSTFSVEFDSSVPSADQLVVTGGSVSLGSGVTLDLSDIALSPQNIGGTTFTIIDYTGQTLSGEFDGLPDGSTITVGLNTFEIDYDNGQTVTLTAQVTNAYDNWVAANYPGLTGGFGDDDDDDGISNGFEWYFFNSNPLVAEGLGAPLVDVTETGPGTFTFVHRRPVDRTGTTENYEWSADLAGFFPSGGTDGTYSVSLTPVSAVADPSNAGYEIVTVSVTAAPTSAPRIFARLEVTNP